jgi:hypothetical protein
MATNKAVANQEVTNQQAVRQGSPDKTRDLDEKNQAPVTNPPREGSPDKTRDI